MDPTFQTMHGLQDIELLAGPPASNAPAIVSSLLLVILIITLTVIAVRRFNSFRSKARRRLRHLQHSLTQQDSDADALESNTHRDTAYRLAHILSLGLKVNGITTLTPLPVELDQHKDRWTQFINDLSVSRFSDNSGKTANIKQLFDDAFFWLKNWP